MQQTEPPPVAVAVRSRYFRVRLCPRTLRKLIIAQVLKWIRDVTRLDIDPECGVAYSLKDGMALCRLMSKLQPGAAIPAPSDSSLAYKQASGHV